jgi:hypothetical protein
MEVIKQGDEQMKTNTAPWDYNRKRQPKHAYSDDVRVCADCGKPVIFLPDGRAYCSDEGHAVNVLSIPAGQYAEFAATLASFGFMMEMVAWGVALGEVDEDPRTPAQIEMDAAAADWDALRAELRGVL